MMKLNYDMSHLPSLQTIKCVVFYFNDSYCNLVDQLVAPKKLSLLLHLLMTLLDLPLSLLLPLLHPLPSLTLLCVLPCNPLLPLLHLLLPLPHLLLIPILLLLAFLPFPRPPLRLQLFPPLLLIPLLLLLLPFLQLLHLRLPFLSLHSFLPLLSLTIMLSSILHHHTSRLSCKGTTTAYLNPCHCTATTFNYQHMPIHKHPVIGLHCHLLHLPCLNRLFRAKARANVRAMMKTCWLTMITMMSLQEVSGHIAILK